MEINLEDSLILQKYIITQDWIVNYVKENYEI